MTKKTAFEQSQEYRDSVKNKFQTLKNEQTKIKQQIKQIAAEMTTAAGLLFNEGKKPKHLKDLKADLAMIDDQIAAIEANGGLSGILQQDERMQELAAAAYAENITELDRLSGEKEALTAETRQQLEKFAALEAQADAHDAAVTYLENQIDALKPFLADKLPLKTSYRHKGAHFPRDYRAAFSDIKKAVELLERSGEGVK